MPTLEECAKAAADTYRAWIVALIESQSGLVQQDERARKLAEFQHAMAQLQIKLAS